MNRFIGLGLAGCVALMMSVGCGDDGDGGDSTGGTSAGGSGAKGGTGGSGAKGGTGGSGAKGGTGGTGGVGGAAPITGGSGGAAPTTGGTAPTTGGTAPTTGGTAPTTGGTAPTTGGTAPTTGGTAATTGGATGTGGASAVAAKVWNFKDAGSITLTDWKVIDGNTTGYSASATGATLTLGTEGISIVYALPQPTVAKKDTPPQLEFTWANATVSPNWTGYKTLTARAKITGCEGPIILTQPSGTGGTSGVGGSGAGGTSSGGAESGGTGTGGAETGGVGTGGVGTGGVGTGGVGTGGSGGSTAVTPRSPTMQLFAQPKSDGSWWSVSKNATAGTWIDLTLAIPGTTSDVPAAMAAINRFGVQVNGCAGSTTTLVVESITVAP